MTNHIQDVDHGDFEICVYQSNLNGQYSFDIRNMHGEVVESYSGFKTRLCYSYLVIFVDIFL